MSIHHTLTSLKDLLKESGLLPSYRVRERLAARYLKGVGLEIGALHLPLRVSPGVIVKYVDLSSREENIRKFPELIANKIVETDYVENGFELLSIPDKSHDFVIANHVLEHASNPLQVLLNWGRIMTDCGKFFVTVPLADKSFDKGRQLTSLDHIINDYRLCLDGRYEEFMQLNRVHYREWLTVSEPCIMSGRNADLPSVSEEVLAQRVEELVGISSEIHFHTFSEESFSELLNYFVSEIDGNFEVLAISMSRGSRECVAVLGKWPRRSGCKVVL